MSSSQWQDTFLFATTIADNICLGLPEATMDGVIAFADPENEAAATDAAVHRIALLRQRQYAALGRLHLVDAAVAWNPTHNLELMLYAHNLTDKAYRTYGFSSGATGNFAQVAPRRTVGLTATYTY